MRGPILIVTRNLPPLTGGMERLTQHLVVALAADHELVVIGPPGCATHLPHSARVIECRSSGAAGFLLEAGWRSITAVLRGPAPAAVIAASGLTAPLAWVAARCRRSATITIVHGLDLVVDHALYRALFLPFIRRASMIIANSKNTAALAVTAGAAADRVRIVHPGVDWPDSLPPRGAFRQARELGQRPLLLSLGRLAARKGIAEFIERVLPRIVARYPDVVFVVIGSEAHDAIRAEHSVGARIRAAITASGLGQHVRLLGHVDDAEVREACRDADVFVFPLRPVAGDVEGFGMVAAEVAALGLRTIAFNEGGVADAILEGVTGRLCPPANDSAFAEAVIEELGQRDDEARRATCHAAARRFAWPQYEHDIRRAIADHIDTPSAPINTARS